jgi:hypothetical protein
MSAEPFEIPLPVVRQVENPQPIIETPQLDNFQMALPSQEQARAVERAFASHQQGQDALGNLVGLASAGMLLHDVMEDTFAEPEDDEDEAEGKRDKGCCH